MKIRDFLLAMMVLSTLFCGCFGKAGREEKDVSQPTRVGVMVADAGRYPLDSLDVVMPDTIEEVVWFLENHHFQFHVLTPKEVVQARSLLKKYIDSGQYKVDHSELEAFGFTERDLPFPLEKYARQYIGYKQKGHVKVYVLLNATCTSGASLRSLHHRLLYVADGGHLFGKATIDLTANKVEWFHLNGLG